MIGIEGRLATPRGPCSRPLRRPLLAIQRIDISVAHENRKPEELSDEEVGGANLANL